MSVQNSSISYTSIFRVILVLVIVFALYLIRDVIALLFISVVLSAALYPWVDSMQKYKIPRAISILIIYVILIGVLSMIVILMMPIIAEQIGQLAKNLPFYYEKFAFGVSQFSGGQTDVSSTLPKALQTLSTSLGGTTKSIFSTISGIFGGLISFFAVLVIVFYITLEENLLKKFIYFFTPKKDKKYVSNLIDRMQMKIGLWMRGQLSLCLIIGIMTWIGLTILGVKYALILAVVAGVLEIVPFIGPLLSAVPAVFVGFSDSLVKVILIIVLYFLIQQFENNIIVPKVMQKAVGLNPIIVILAVLIGAKLGGWVGAIIAVPVAASIGVFLSDVISHSTENKS